MVFVSSFYQLFLIILFTAYLLAPFPLPRRVQERLRRKLPHSQRPLTLWHPICFVHAYVENRNYFQRAPRLPRLIPQVGVQNHINCGFDFRFRLSLAVVNDPFGSQGVNKNAVVELASINSPPQIF